jgi:hypothetical protein
MHITRSNCRKFIETMSNKSPSLTHVVSMNLLHIEQMNTLLIVSMNFLHLERVIYIISYSCRLYEPPKEMVHITRSMCRKFIETMSNKFICSRCRSFTETTWVRDDAYHPFNVQEVNLLHLKQMNLLLSLYEPPTPRTDECVTHSLYELPAPWTGDIHHLLLMSSLWTPYT